MATQAHNISIDELGARFAAVRALSSGIAAPLSDADATIQPMPDASPAKWHLAHTTWFFETFVLRDHAHGYRLFDERWPFLFNSYYEGEGARHARDRRGMISRPSLAETLDYRSHVDAALLAALPDLDEAVPDLILLGLQHEQQHQELMLMDMQATFAANPLAPAVWPSAPSIPTPVAGPIGWIEGPTGIVEIGDDGASFAFDCERPRHGILLHPHAIADRLVTNHDWTAFIADGGYARPELWLADGWAWVRDNAVGAPKYWRQDGDDWHRFGLDGLRPIDLDAPVCHVSYYEADAFARWAGARLPTEAEWETAVAGADPTFGNQLDAPGPVQPMAGNASFFSDVWQWTMSAFLPHPGFRPASGTVGEYNGKFMSGQFVLKGASCATPRGHSRASYRNFFYPHQRWQYAGLRLARDM